MLTSEFMHVIYSALICSTCKFADIQVNAGMADFQHVVPVHAAQSSKRKLSDVKNDYEHLGSGTFFFWSSLLCGLQVYVMSPFLVDVFLLDVR